jgi:hypothetical protein
MCSWARCYADPTSGSWLTAAESRTSQARSLIRCIRKLRDHERPLYDPPSLPLDSQIDSKGYALAVFIEHVAG